MFCLCHRTKNCYKFILVVIEVNEFEPRTKRESIHVADLLTSISLGLETFEMNGKLCQKLR